MDNYHRVRVDNEYLGLNDYCGMSVEWYLQINHKTAVGLATAIRKEIKDARTKAFVELLDAVAVKAAFPSTYTDVKLILEQMKERDDGD